ncbi:MAG TPA: magnesium transporter [Gammaproteobacteria bacterium]|jgi:magnesium transporter|nr:magnesium transporter [Gammaproteobacteria bacterium]
MMQHSEKKLGKLISDLERDQITSIQQTLTSLHPSEIARLLESLTPGKRKIIWQLVDQDDEGDVLKELVEDVRQNLIGEMDATELIAATQDMELDDLADLLVDLPETVTEQVITALDRQDQIRLESVMSYDEDTAGGLTNPRIISVRRGITIEVLMRYLKRLNKLPEHTNYIYIVNRNDEYLGALKLVDLFLEDKNKPIETIMDESVKAMLADVDVKQVAMDFQNLDLISIPVIDEKNRLLGQITVDDVVDVIQDQVNSEIFNMAGLDDEDDIFAPVILSTKRRAVWLGMNLITAFVVAGAIGLFQEILQQIVILAVLMPIVASMGGVAGNQTLILVIRGIAMGKIQRSNARKLLVKEGSVALLNGFIWSIVVSVLTVVLFLDADFQNYWKIGIIVGAAMLLNIFASAIAGVAIPFLLKKMGIDPALAGGVLMITLTDVLGFITFLGLATLFLLG